MAPRVSVVLPTYNHAEFIEQSIDSVLAQTLTDFELIVVDDGSSDDTLERLARYEAPRMSVISLPVNSKIPTALNEGFARAGGQYFTWTSADNWMLPPCLETLAGGLDEHPEVGLVYAGHQIVGDRQGVSRKERFELDRLLSGDNVVGPCFMYRRSVAEEVGRYDPDCFGAEDYDMWLRIATRYPLMALPQVLYVYRYHKKTVTAQQAQSIAAARQRAMDRTMVAAHRCRGSPAAEQVPTAAIVPSSAAGSRPR